MNATQPTVDVLVYGAGAIGQYLGGRLALAGVSVHFVARASTVAALQRDGLVVREFDGCEDAIDPQRIGASEDLARAPTPRLVLGVLAAADIVPAKVTPVPSSWIPRLLRLPTPLFRLAAKRMLAIHPAARSSMYDDRVAGRVTEIDALCGAVVRLAQRVGREAPLNRRLVEIITTLAAGEFWSGAALRERLELGARRP